MLEEGLKYVHLDCILFVRCVTIWINEISGKFGIHFNFNNTLAPLSHNAVGSRSIVELGVRPSKTWSIYIVMPPQSAPDKCCHKCENAVTYNGVANDVIKTGWPYP